MVKLRDFAHQHPALAFLSSWTLCCWLLSYRWPTGVLWLAGVLLFFGYFAPRLFPDSQRFGPIRLRLESTDPVVALTFDDGPGPNTGEILERLRRLEVKATFFMIGEEVERRPELARRVLAEGHTVANHTQTHPNLLWTSPEPEIESCQRTIEAMTGYRPSHFRPPYGYKDKSVLAAARSVGLETVNWSINPLDFTDPDPETLVGRVLEELAPGAIVLLHDGRGDRRATLNALPLLVEEIRMRGYRFVTL